MNELRELELVAVDPEFNRTISATMLTPSSDGWFMINISEGLGETMNETCSFASKRHSFVNHSGDH